MEDLNKLGCQIKDVDQSEAEEELEEEDDDIEEVDDEKVCHYYVPCEEAVLILEQ